MRRLNPVMPVMAAIDLVIPAYNGAATIEACLDSVSRQRVPQGWRLQTTVVDDSSTDDTGPVATEHELPQVRVLRNQQNLGRARSRNIGAALGRGEIVVFLDCDCELDNPQVLSRFIERLEEGDECVFANVVATGADFAARFTNDTARKRFAAAQKGDFMAMTSACFAIRRSVLEDIGGFCEDYRHYGFEDRDFIASLLSRKYRLAVDEHCLVQHFETFDPSTVARKFFEAAKFSAPIFQRRFPEAYARSMYGKIDPRLKSFLLRKIVSGAAGFQPIAILLTEAGLHSDWLPHAVKKTLLRWTSFSAYVKGCRASSFN